MVDTMNAKGLIDQPCTCRYADAEAFPCTLLTTQVYLPVSFWLTLSTINLPYVLVELSSSVYLLLSGVRAVSWKNHCTVCNGSATAEQVNTAVSPSSLVSFCGLASITGAAVDTRLYTLVSWQANSNNYNTFYLKVDRGRVSPCFISCCECVDSLVTVL